MTVTAANVALLLSQAVLAPAGIRIQGFGPDDVTDIDPVKILEEIMGVDGVLSFGFVWAARRQSITLMGDSASNDFFDTINRQQEATQDVYPLNGIIALPAIGRKFILTNGGLENYKPIPPVKKILNPRTYNIIWNKVTPVPS
jgi:Tail fiber protein gp32